MSSSSSSSSHPSPCVFPVGLSVVGSPRLRLPLSGSPRHTHCHTHSHSGIEAAHRNSSVGVGVGVSVRQSPRTGGRYATPDDTESMTPNDSPNTRSLLKDHPSQPNESLLHDHPYLFVLIGVTLVLLLVWLTVAPNSLIVQLHTPSIEPTRHQPANIQIDRDAASRVADTSTDTPMPNQSKQAEILDQPPTPPPDISTPPPQDPLDQSHLLTRADLVDSDLRCASDSTAAAAQCDLSWGSPSAVDHTRDELDPKESWTKPNDFYTFQAGIIVTQDGPGALVRINMRDLCCTASDPLPLAYFRVTAHGASQAASNPPLSLGPLPSALGRGHQPVHLVKKHFGSDVHLQGVNHERVIQTFLPLPEPGHYQIQVKLLHFNVSQDMVTENYQMNSKLYEKRPGVWVDEYIKNARSEIGTNLFIPPVASVDVPSYSSPSSLPLCGADGGRVLGGVSPASGVRVGWPLAGRWVYQPEPGEDALADRTMRDKKELIEHSKWVPFFCRFDEKVTFAATLAKMQWVHFTGDSNTRYMFFRVCEMANGTATENPPSIPRFLDPPHMCFGPSSPDGIPDKLSGLTVGSNSRWVLTYTNWFWGKRQTLEELDGKQPNIDFNFKLQCSKFVAQNKSGIFYGWPECENAPAFIQQLSGPGATYFGWGSHAAEFGANPLTEQYFDTREAFRLPFLYRHPVIFPLTTANTPSRIPAKFGRQQIMRNNERVHASNIHLTKAVMKEHLNYATRTPGGATAEENVIPIFDVFSPTHAAYDLLAYDAVHFDEFYSHQQPRWLMHYLFHSPNFGPKN